MKYIITESRINEFRKRFLDDFLKSHYVHKIDTYIVVSEPYTDDDTPFPDYMEYDHWDGRLWIEKNFVKFFSDMYGFDDVDETKKFISDWFSRKFDVEVKYVKA